MFLHNNDMESNKDLEIANAELAIGHLDKDITILTDLLAHPDTLTKYKQDALENLKIVKERRDKAIQELNALRSKS